MIGQSGLEKMLKSVGVIRLGSSGIYTAEQLTLRLE